ncbi:MAG: hypothetical protein AMXMBFR58_22730 [Phycisphaerae bacterium]
MRVSHSVARSFGRRTDVDDPCKHGVQASCRVDGGRDPWPHPRVRNAAEAIVAHIHNGAHAGGRYTRENHVHAAGATGPPDRIARAGTYIMPGKLGAS